MKRMKTDQAMSNLSQQQKEDVERIFSKAVQCTRNKDYSKAAALYSQAAAYGHPGAQNNLGNLFQNGNGVKKDLQKAFHLYLDSARHGSLAGMRNVAACYLDGIGTESDFDTAVAWLETAAEQKDRNACIMLVNAYDRWDHRDEEQKIIWHKKAAQYGDADSCFFLGDYYVKSGQQEDLSLAIDFYDCAARNGKAEMKLKVAKAFDIAENEQSLNLEKAKYWYSEVLSCDDDQLRLDAAMGLDDLMDHDGNVVRPALDIGKAYMTYRALAMKDNKKACSLAAYCNEIGKGTASNIDAAIMFYQKAGEADKADWCRRKKAGVLGDSVYEAQVDNIMPFVDRNVHTNSREYYRSMKRYDSDRDRFKMCEYDGRIYYQQQDSGNEIKYLCSSDMEGDDVEIISEVHFSGENVQVNITGIYLYTSESDSSDRRLRVQHFDFDGNLLAECCDEDENSSGDREIYFYDNNVYFVSRYSTYYSDKDIIKCMHVDIGVIEVLYEKAEFISGLCATGEKLIFFARYCSEERDEDGCSENDEGWMMMDLMQDSVECISNPYCSPENIVDKPEVYDDESPEYNEKCSYNRHIVSFDLNRGIFWTERRASGLEGKDSAHLESVKYWEPKSLWGNRDEVIPDMPVWKIVNESTNYGREYFDGVYYYCAKDCSNFESYDKYGNVYNWSDGNGGHGYCDNYNVIGDYLFLDLAAYNEEQYPLAVCKIDPIRKSWIKGSVPKEAIERFKGKNTPKK